MTKKEMNSNIWKYYAFNFLNMFTIFMPYIYYYFQELGFALGQIAILQSSMAVTLFIFEIPSGYIADKFGRRNSLILGALFQIASVIILYTAESFYPLILAHVLLGISISFVSGADSALIYDTLLTMKRESLYKKIEGKAKFFGEIAVIIAAILGSLLIRFGIKQTILFTLVAYIVLLIVTCTLREPARHRPIEKVPMYREFAQIFSIVKRSLKNTKLLGLFIYSFIILGVSNTIFIMYQPYFRATNLPLYMYGIIFAIFSIFTAVTALKAHEIENKLGVYRSLILMPVFLVISLIGAGIAFVWFGFILFFFREAVRGFVIPVLGDYTNKLIASNERATVLSIGSMFARLGFVIISIAFGFLSDSYGLKIMFISTGIALLIFTLITMLILRRRI